MMMHKKRAVHAPQHGASRFFLPPMETDETFLTNLETFLPIMITLLEQMGDREVSSDKFRAEPPQN